MPYTIPSFTVSPGSVYQPRQSSGETYVLDQIGGVVGCWSTRQLMASGSGNIIRGRDATTNEADYTSLSYPAGIVTLANGGDAFSPAVYDQSGNGNNATQTTAANQPKLVDAGALIASGGVGVMEFDGVNSSSLSAPNATQIKSVCLKIKATGLRFIGFQNPSQLDFFLCAEQGSAGSPTFNSGSPLYYVDASLIAGATRGTLYDSIVTGAFKFVTVTNLDLSTWAGGFGIFYTSALSYRMSGQANDIISFNTNLTQSEVTQLHASLSL